MNNFTKTFILLSIATVAFQSYIIFEQRSEIKSNKKLILGYEQAVNRSHEENHHLSEKLKSLNSECYKVIELALTIDSEVDIKNLLSRFKDRRLRIPEELHNKLH